MPDLDGFTFLDRLRDTVERDAVVVVVLTTSFNPADFERAGACPQVRACAPKPLTIEASREIASRYLAPDA